MDFLSFPELSFRTLYAVPAIICSSLLAWRLWRFSLAPILYPNDALQLPYWIPFLGHATQFVKDPQATFAQGRKAFGRLGRPYGVTIAGETFYVINSPQDYSILYRNSTAFTFDPFIEQVYRAFKLPEAAIQKLYRPTSSGEKADSKGHPKKDVVNISHDIIVTEMRGKQTNRHAMRVKRQLDSMIDLQSICSRFSTTQHDSSTVISLLKLCFVMISATGEAAFFGNALAGNGSALPEAFVDFDKNVWQIFYRRSLFWDKRLKEPKAILLKAFESYSEKPLDQRPDMPPFLQNWETQCKKAGLRSSEIAIMMLIQYFGLNTNTTKAGFWLFCHILFHPELIPTIRNETGAAFASESFDYDVIENSQCLNGIWFETLRVAPLSLSFRHIAQDFEIKGVKLCKGRKVMLNPRIMHRDPEYFGERPLEFDPDRFINNKSYQRHPGYRPFGGGEAECPGRTMAKQTILTFVSYMLHKYDVELAKPQEFPKPGLENHPGVVVLPPAEGSDLVIRMTERRKD